MARERDDAGAAARLAGAFAARSGAEGRAHYDAWAERYDADNIARGLRTHFVGAAALAAHAPRRGPLLDAACGTGLVGEVLARVGFGPLVGCDLSHEMLARAQDRGLYARLDRADLTSLPYSDGAFASFVCIGAFGPGHAPPECLAELVRVTAPGGVGVFNLREDTFAPQGFAVAMERLSEAGRWRERFRSEAFPSYLFAEPDLLTRIFVYEVTAPA